MHKDIINFNKKIINISVEKLMETSSIFKNTNNKDFFTFEKIKTLRGGKSGDLVMLVRNCNNLYVLKIFTPGNENKQTKDDNEILYHLKFMKLFKNLTPCPKIFMHGLINKVPFEDTTNTTNAKYVIMEALTPPFELENLISNRCIQSENNVYADSIDINNIIIQLFYILTKMKLNNLYHCDMHTQNIMIVNNHNEIILDFNHINNKFSFKLGNHLVKIIDFGEGAETTKSRGKYNTCRLLRTTSGALEDLKNKCQQNSKLSSMSTLVLERFSTIAGDVDVNFFINIIKLISGFHNDFKSIDFNLLKKCSELMGDSKIIGPKKKNTRYQVQLSMFLNEISKIVKQNAGYKKKKSISKKMKRKRKTNRKIRNYY